MSSDGHTSDGRIKDSINNVKDIISEEVDKEFHKDTKQSDNSTAFNKPECDVTDELDEEVTSLYQQLIGGLRWACKLGRLDILYEVSILSQHLALPRRGHLKGAYHIFGYLAKHERSRIVFDVATKPYDMSGIVPVDWKDQ